MNIRQLAAAVGIAATFSLSACGSEPGDAETPPLAGAPIGGAFTLVGGDGETVTDQDFAGEWRLVYFGYTYCPDICPTDAQRMAAAYSQVAEEAPALADRLQPIFISIDPERDTPEIAQEFAGAFHPDMIGLSGSEEQVAAAADAFRAYRAKGEPRDDGFYLMDHSAYIYLLDADGNPINFYDHGQSPAEIAADVEKWMRS